MYRISAATPGWPHRALLCLGVAHLLGCVSPEPLPPQHDLTLAGNVTQPLLYSRSAVPTGEECPVPAAWGIEGIPTPPFLRFYDVDGFFLASGGDLTTAALKVAFPSHHEQDGEVALLAGEWSMRLHSPISGAPTEECGVVATVVARTTIADHDIAIPLDSEKYCILDGISYSSGTVAEACDPGDNVGDIQDWYDALRTASGLDSLE